MSRLHRLGPSVPIIIELIIRWGWPGIFPGPLSFFLP